MSNREKTLAFLVGGAVVVLINVFVGKFFLDNYRRYQEDKAKAERELAGFRIMESERDRWARRDAWLNAQLQPMGDKDVANKNLSDFVRDLAKKHEITLENPAMGVANQLANYTTLSINLECKGKWEHFIYFLHELQNPTAFLVVDAMNIKVDPSDKTQFKATMKISRWFAPIGIKG